MTPFETTIARLVARDRANQGLPERITDEAALARIAAALAIVRRAPENTTARHLHSVERSGSEAAHDPRRLPAA